MTPLSMASSARVRTVDLMKKGLRPNFPFVFFQQGVRTVDLMKKGLRPIVHGDTPPATSQNRRPDEEGIKTVRSAKCPTPQASEP